MNRLKFFFFNNINFNQFTFIVVALGFITDLFNTVYLYQYFIVKRIAEKTLMASMQIKNITTDNVDPIFMRELEGTIFHTFIFMLFVILLVNFVFYFFFLKRKNFATKYLYGYFWAGLMLTSLMVFEGFPVGGFLELVNLSSILVYGYLLMGFSHFKTDLNLSVKTPAQ
jgi:hypothetical protein